MVIVVDSGSYKSDWMFRPEREKTQVLRTKGMNPFFTTEKEIVKIINHLPGIRAYVEQVSEVYFFGSGCTSPDRREIVSNAVSAVFPSAFVSIENDVLGSAYATCGITEGFVASLGTGSNVSYFDGEFVKASKQGLGYVLGDTGSGSWFGKRLITSYLYESMPEDLALHFGEKFNISKSIVLENVYRRKNPNVYLASFAPFLSDYKNHPFISTLIHKGLSHFVETNICVYPDFKTHICHFAGSIAFHFESELREVCHEHGVKVGEVIQQPIQNLYQYIIKRENLTF